MLFKQDWFQCRMWISENMTDFYLGDNYESSVIFIITGYQYISSAAAFNFGYTWRRSWWSNYIFGKSASSHLISTRRNRPNLHPNLTSGSLLLLALDQHAVYGNVAVI